MGNTLMAVFHAAVFAHMMLGSQWGELLESQRHRSERRGTVWQTNLECPLRCHCGYFATVCGWGVVENGVGHGRVWWSIARVVYAVLSLGC
ncbi:hypothetical protein L210DRAFT_3537112 [Boletus edulis BED1]|uniref:Secreted protein n=1 Tax=Boletus edulis BED1 TaxID=1328754 RepID=A0AAD4BW73_BOLED|nr:hypothetical protein L210DRAFT_3537112 [Boletus edulis BED1]